MKNGKRHGVAKRSRRKRNRKTSTPLALVPRRDAGPIRALLDGVEPMATAPPRPPMRAALDRFIERLRRRRA